MGTIRLSAQLAALCLVAAAWGCGSKEAASPPVEECSVSAPTECEADAPANFAAVKPIFEEQCATCHGRVQGGPWPLDEYQDVADWSDLVRDELVNCTMPPADSGVYISNAERLRILKWLRCGLPE